MQEINRESYEDAREAEAIREALDEVLTPEYKDFIRVLAQSVRSELVIIDDETAIIREIKE